MKKIVFLTRNFEPGQFTTAWSYLTDENGQPCFGEIELLDDRVVCRTTEKKVALNALLEVPGFGKVMLRTAVENAGKKEVDLMDSLVRGRAEGLRREIDKMDEKKRDLWKSRVKQMVGKNSRMVQLHRLLMLGESLVMRESRRQLRARIKNGEMKDFMIGGQAFGVDKGSKYKKFHRDNFDLGIAPMYFFLLKPDSKKKTDWSLTDRVVEWVSKTGRPIKGHPLVWTHKFARPEWMLEMSFEELKEFVVDHLGKVIRRYGDRIKMWDIVNEIPTQDANGYDLNMDQLMELTKLVADTVKRLQPEAERIINISDIFGPKSYVHDSPSIPPVHFLKLCEKHGIEYESIGLQFYMGMRAEFACRELLNISQEVDEYLQFGKPIHFSELGWPSKHDVDPNCFFGKDHPAVAGYWHRGWDEELQAEFAEKIYTLFASKPGVKSITWWDLTDSGNHEDIGSRFIPFSGLTRRDFSPKPIVGVISKIREKVHTELR